MPVRQFVVAVLVSVATLSLTVPSLAQTRVTVDGAKNPELIPDRVAVGMFLSAIAIPIDADAKTEASMKAKTSRLGLNRADTGILRKELAALHARLTLQRASSIEAYEEARRVRTPQAIATAQGTSEQRRTLTCESYERLLETLIADGAKKLRAQIALVKSQTKGIAPAER